MSSLVMLHAKDPKTEILEKIGDLSKVDIFNNQVLVAVYIRPEKTKGGIILAGQTRDEDKYQGKVGLVVKMGSQAFVPSGDYKFDDINVSEDDWVFFRPSDGWSITVNDVLCRILDDVNVRGKITHPDQVW